MRFGQIMEELERYSISNNH